MPAGEPFTLSVYQFFCDFGLYLAAGILLAVFNTLAFDFPVSSGAKVLMGFITFGVFAGLDNGLQRERCTPPGPARSEVPAEKIFPITRRLTVIFGGIALLTGIMGALVIIKDVDYILANVDSESPAFIRKAVFTDMAFVIGIVLLLSLRLMRAYGENLRRMLDLQIDSLDAVARGDLETRVPIVTRDEFSLIASRTNEMIQTLRRANEEQQAMFDVSLALATELDLDRLLTRIVSATRDFVDAERASLFLHDPASDTLWARVAEGVEEEIRFPADEGLAGHVFRTGETVTVAEAYADPRFNADIDSVTGFRTSSILCVPIIHQGGRSIGVIQALNRRSGEFTDACAETLRAFAAQAAVALVNAQLFSDLDSMRRYNESILQSLSNGVVSVDREGRLVKANEAARELFALGEEDVDQPLTAVLGDANRHWLALLGTGVEEKYLADATVVGLDGESHAVNVSRVPLADLNDEPIGALLVLDDITTEKRVRTTLSRYLPSQVAARVLEDPDNNLGGVSQTATVLFSDIRGFTSLSETIGARATVAMLNDYFSVMAEAVNVHHGIIDKYLGDAIMAVFGVPFAGESDADQAVLASISMLGRLRLFNDQRERRGEAPVAIGIGLSTGEVVAGNVGSERRMDYTVIGDTVNLAARLEAATKAYGADVVASEATVAALEGSYPMRALDRIRVRGKSRAVEIFQFFSPEHAPNATALEAFAVGRAAFIERSWREARRHFETAIEQTPEDRACDIYIQRCRRFEQVPPPTDWDGVGMV